MEFLYTKNPDAERPIIVIDKHIGFDEDVYDETGALISKGDGAGIIGAQFLDEFFDLANAGHTECEIWINSPGGKMMEAYDIFSVMKRSSMKPDTLNIGVAASCAGWFQLAGKKVRMMDYATFMCHDPQGSDEGHEAMKMSIAKIISEGSGRNGKEKLSVDKALELMSQTTFLTAQECLDLGLCDEVIPSGLNGAYRKINDKWQAGKQYLNNATIINDKNKKMENISLVTNELELSEDASAKSIAKAITSLKNKLNASEKKVTDLTNEMEDKDKELAAKNDYDNLKKERDEYCNKCNDLEDKMKNLTDEVNALKKEKEDAEKEKEEAENKAKEVQLENDCTNMVNGFKNKIGDKPEDIAEWVATAKTIGIEKAKNMLEKLPIFKNGTRIQDITSPVGGKKTGTMDDAMRDLAEKRKANKK